MARDHEKRRAARRRYHQRIDDKIRKRAWIASEAGRENARGRRSEKAAFLRQLKSVPCADCKQTFDPVCMDFDHRDGATKIAPVAHMVAYGFDLIRAEVAKCDIVCSMLIRLSPLTVHHQ